MTKPTIHILSAALISTALWAAPSFAQSKGSPSEGSGEASRDAAIGGTEFTPRGAAIPLPTVEGEMRDAPLADEETVLRGLNSVTRSRDGKETVTPPSEELKRAVDDMLKAPAGEKADGPDKKAEDPAFGQGEENRQVFGSDDRIQVQNTTTYPFTAVGYLEGKSKSGQYTTCSATLIGPRTVLTAAQCLYSHQDGGWLDEFLFVPAMASVDNIPYGGFSYETASIMQAYIDGYKSGYSDVLTVDLGLVTLQDPIGDSLGWFGYANYDNLGDFSANLVGYPADKPAGTMWRSTCNVVAENIHPDIFTYQCDTAAGSSGSAVYVYDESSGGRIAVGVNVAESQSTNVAVRLNQGNVEWVNSLWK